MEVIPESILDAYGLPSGLRVTRIGTGHIHETYKVSTTPGEGGFILQRVNKNVFKKPELITSNLRIAADYLKQHSPDYLFLASMGARDGSSLVYDDEFFPWRLFPYQENTITIDKAETVDEAFHAAAGFAELTGRLNKVDVGLFSETIPDFHDLRLRFTQFEDACGNAPAERMDKARQLVNACQSFSYLVKEYDQLVDQEKLVLRITHNDTKVNNILFDKATRKTVCVIDLDTLMPGYFIYDLGDMVRTFVSPVSEEEKDFSKIVFRKEIYDAVLEGYLSVMEPVLTHEEKSAIPFAGKMMTYIMALRFLTDYLNEDVYYHTTYPGQNLARTGNQMRLLELQS